MLTALTDKTHIPITWGIALMVLALGWWANANDTTIKEVQEVQAETAKQLQTLVTAQQLAGQQAARLKADFDKHEREASQQLKDAAQTARDNHDALIRIAAKLDVELDE